jgi:predicted flavoprotein YhiN
MCAATAAAGGIRTLLVDHAPTPGKKLCITGGGKGNITNLSMSVEDFVGEDPQFCQAALAAFPPEQMLDMLRAARIPVEEREEGQIFCTRSAKDVLRMLLDACRSCDFAMGNPVEAVEHPSLPPRSSAPVHAGDTLFTVRAADGIWRAPALVIATGGSAWPQIGATDFGIRLARRFGHSAIPFRPALVGLTMPAHWPLRGLAGVSLRVTLALAPTQAVADLPERPAQPPRAAGCFPTSLLSNQHLPPGGIAARNLPLLFTHKGLSGPAALQASLYWRPGMALRIDFLPERPLALLLDAVESGRVFAGNLLKRLLPSRLCDALVPEDIARRKTAELSRAQRDLLCRIAHEHQVIPSGTEGLRKAEIAAGGIATRETSPDTLESRLVPHLFFCGEALDVAGRLGGYNLHWAFASGRLAGQSLIAALSGMPIRSAATTCRNT